MSVPYGTFPAACECTLKDERVTCAGNETDCDVWWVVAYRNDHVRRTLLERIVGLFGAFAWWRR